MALAAERIEEIIAWLTNIRSRPQMFFVEYTPDNVVNSLYWFHQGFLFSDYQYTLYQHHVWTQHGCDANRPVLDLRERGISEENIVLEILDVEIEAWNHYLQEVITDSKSS